jgi:hypothetical protein
MKLNIEIFGKGPLESKDEQTLTLPKVKFLEPKAQIHSIKLEKEIKRLNITDLIATKL